MADFISGYISGAAGILIGSPLDIIKTRLQASTRAPIPARAFPTPLSYLAGTAPPLVTYGALNAVLFASYNRVLPLLPTTTPLTSTFLAGAVGGLATFALSAPTEVVKCRAQLLPGGGGVSSWGVAKMLLRTHGVRGLYIGGAVTAARDAIGYGFYFATYEACKPLFGGGATGVLLAGGVAGCATWASVYPLDVVKTRVQTQVLGGGEAGSLLRDGGRAWHGGLGAWAAAKAAYREGGSRVFFDGLGICMARAFLVNAVQWAIYEYIMQQFRESSPVHQQQLLDAAPA